MNEIVKNLWFRDFKEPTPYINDTVVRIRAGILLLIPMYMILTLLDAIYGVSWIVTDAGLVDTWETDFDGRIIYQAEVVKRTFDYSIQTLVLFYGLFEMLVGMNRWTAWLSPTIWLANLLAMRQPKVWKPLAPKRFAWTIGASFIVLCLVFFNPSTFASGVNSLAGTELLPETRQYLPYWLPMVFVWVCFSFMWLEAILGFCVGCKIHALLVRLGIFKEECVACNNLDWEEIARRKAERDKGLGEASGQ